MVHLIRYRTSCLLYYNSSYDWITRHKKYNMCVKEHLFYFVRENILWTEDNNDQEMLF